MHSLLILRDGLHSAVRTFHLLIFIGRLIIQIEIRATNTYDFDKYDSAIAQLTKLFYITEQLKNSSETLSFLPYKNIYLQLRRFTYPPSGNDSTHCFICGDGLLW